MKEDEVDTGVLMWRRPEEAATSTTTAHIGLLNKSEEPDHGAPVLQVEKG